MKTNRREFVKTTAAASAAVAIAPFNILKGKPNEKVLIAMMGVRSRGLALAENAATLPNAEIIYVCDVHSEYQDKCIAKVNELQGKKPKGEKDIRKILENKDVDAVIMATPDHWHAPGAMMALAAGKHVYVEKPCSHNPAEGEMLRQAVKTHKRVLQMGNQRRSWPNMNQLINELHSGIIGRVYFAKGWYTNAREPIGYGKVVAVPDKLDYELWQGPAPRTPYKDNIEPYNWHWFWRWGTGEALNNGTHEIDMMRWGMGEDFPSRVVAIGGRYHYQDDWEFPDTMVATYEFEDGKAFTWEGRSCNDFRIEGSGRGVIYYGTEGTVVVPGGDGYKVFDAKNKLVKEVKENTPQADATNTVSPNASLDAVHIDNFLMAIREGKANNSPIDEAHKSVLMCQLANISWKTGRPLDIDQRNGHIIGDKQAMELWGREYEPGWQPRV